MPRNISFFLTTQQIRERTKTVTRRLGWKFAKIGDVLNACVKCQGLKKGEKIDRICQIRITDVRREPLSKMYATVYGRDEARKEGFPDMWGCNFVDMFCKNMKCEPETQVTRIEFEYIEG